ncbi:hypothetical protein ABEI56_11905, partial [Peribacillus castrilensis]|uniref:hypothetical protein n=1 Tax=Peribacillus castrilensis TaxID=2897690 RepID=UPI003D2A9336
CLQSFSKKIQLIEDIRSLSADCLPSLLDASAFGVLASQLFGRSVANLFNLERFHSFNQVKNIKDIQIFFKSQIGVRAFRSSFVVY